MRIRSKWKKLKEKEDMLGDSFIFNANSAEFAMQGLNKQMARKIQGKSTFWSSVIVRILISHARLKIELKCAYLRKPTWTAK